MKESELPGIRMLRRAKPPKKEKLVEEPTVEKLEEKTIVEPAAGMAGLFAKHKISCIVKKHLSQNLVKAIDKHVNAKFEKKKKIQSNNCIVHFDHKPSLTKSVDTKN